MAGSTARALKRRVLDLLEANESLADVQLNYGYPGPDAVEAESIWLGRASAEHQPAGMTARTTRLNRNEDGALEITIYVSQPSGSPEEVDDRIFELGAFVEETIADNRIPGVSGVKWMQVDSYDYSPMYEAAGSGHLALLVYTVAWQSYLS